MGPSRILCRLSSGGRNHLSVSPRAGEERDAALYLNPEAHFGWEARSGNVLAKPLECYTMHAALYIDVRLYIATHALRLDDSAPKDRR